MIYLGVDCGTQSTKTIALDGDSGAILAQVGQAYDVMPGLPPGHMEQEPKTWVNALDATVRQVVSELGARAGEVKGIGLSGQQHGFVALDGDGQVIRPAKLWCDTSTVEQCDKFRAEFGGTSGLIELMGNDVLPGFTAPKILWLKENEPENFSRLAHVLLPHDYLNWYMTGNFFMEYGDASGTALMDVRSRTWCEPVVKFIDEALMDKLPALSSSNQSPGVLRPEVLEAWGLGGDVVVSSGGGDNMMGAIGTGNCSAGRVTASLGTSGTIYAYSDSPVVDPDGEIAAFCDSTDGWLPLLCTMNVTVTTETVRELLGQSLADLESTAAAVPAGADGLLLLPYLNGERTPNLANGSGVLHGMTTRNLTPGHLARAAMEGATLGMAYGLERLRMLGVTPSEIRLTGGGSNSKLWRQICADIFGCRVVTMQSAEGAALGGAIQALAAVDSSKSVAEWSDQLVAVNEAEAAEPSSGFDHKAQLEKHTSLMRSLAEKGHL